MKHRIMLTGAGGAASSNFRNALDLTGNYEYVGVDTSPEFLELSGIKTTYVVPPSDHPEFIPRLLEIAETEAVDLIHPQPDPDVYALSHHQDLFPKKTFLPDPSVIRLCQNKIDTHRQLKFHRVDIPFAWDLENLDGTSPKDILEEWFKNWPIGWLRAKKGAGSKASLPISSVLQGLGWLEYWAGKNLSAEDFMISEFLPGKEYAYQSVWFNGELVTGQLRERVEYLNGGLMPSGQSSSPSIAVTVSDETIEKTARDAVQAVSPQPHGVFCVDLKRDVGKNACVTEINAGRFFTTSNFFAHAGLNMPDLYCELGINGSFEDRPGRLDQLPDGLYWYRHMDMGFYLGGTK